MRGVQVFGVVLLCGLAGCVTAPVYNHPSKPLAEKQKDYVECMATANQAAQGAGGYFSDRAMRSGFFEHARDRYLAMCLESRGWSQGAQSSAAPSAPPPPRMEEHDFRQCAQVALVKLGKWDGPVNGEDSPRWREVWGRYLDSHAETSHDHRQVSIRMVIDRELATIRERMNWEACAS
jgi:hypothetical protein